MPSRPRSFLCTVVYGMRIVSSWSWPNCPAPFGFHDTKHLERLVPNPDDVSRWGPRLRQTRLSRTTEPSTATLAVPLDMRVIEKGAVLQVPKPDQREFDVGPLDLCGPVLVCRQLPGHAYSHWLPDTRALGTCSRIAATSTALRVGAAPMPWLMPPRLKVPGPHHEHVCPGGLDLLFDFLLCPATQERPW